MNWIFSQYGEAVNLDHVKKIYFYMDMVSTKHKVFAESGDGGDNKITTFLASFKTADEARDYIRNIFLEG